MDQADVSLLVEVIGAGGVIIAGLLANVVTQALIFRKQDKRRWLEPRAEAFADLYTATKELWACYDYGTGEHDAEPGVFEAASAKFNAAYSRVMLLCERVETGAAALKLWHAGALLEHRGNSTWEEVQDSLEQATDNFMDAARVELKLKPLIAKVKTVADC